MIWASSWQWERYEYKVELLKQYESHDLDSAIDLNALNLDTLESDKAKALVHKKVKVKGYFDLNNQMIIINRRHKTGSGYWLLSPLMLPYSEKIVLMSRGFIPFVDREPISWKKYDLKDVYTFEVHKWLYPDLPLIAKQLPYPIVEDFFLQKLGGPNKQVVEQAKPPKGLEEVETAEEPSNSPTKPLTSIFPAESITFKVPPSTHFGYTIEWLLLALATLVISFLLQAYPRKPKKKAPMVQAMSKELH